MLGSDRSLYRKQPKSSKTSKLPNFELLPQLPQAKGHPFYFFFLQTNIRSLQKIYYFSTTSHTFVPIIHQLVQGVMGTHSGPLSPKIFYFYFFIFSIRSCINCENFIEKYQYLTILSNFFYFYGTFFTLKIAYFWPFRRGQKMPLHHF